MSSPAENARPDPVMTTTRMPSSICAEKKNSVRSRFIGPVWPLSLSGSFIVTTAMPRSSVATSKPR